MNNKDKWQQFRDIGLLWWINTILHMFGWAIYIIYDENDKNFENILDVYPDRCKFRGFGTKAVVEGYRKVSNYLKENIDELAKEANE
ncbi:MAG: hypothetical protein ACM3O3_12530 [Syntrophothermus sp.]